MLSNLFTGDVGNVFFCGHCNRPELSSAGINIQTSLNPNGSLRRFPISEILAAFNVIQFTCRIII